MSLAILAPILAEIGAPILKRVLLDKLPAGIGRDIADSALDTIAEKLGVEPTAESIKDAYDSDPAGTTATLREIEAENAERWMAYLTSEGAYRATLLEREDSKSFFHSGWRPALSWLLIWLFLQNATLFPLVNSAFGAKLELTPWDQIVAFAGIWLVIYGGGHTVKNIWGRG